MLTPEPVIVTVPGAEPPTSLRVVPVFGDAMQPLEGSLSLRAYNEGEKLAEWVWKNCSYSYVDGLLLRLQTKYSYTGIKATKPKS